MRRLTRGRSQVTFDTLNQPNLDYDVSVSVRVGTTRVFFTVDDSGAITTTETVTLAFRILQGMPLSFTTVVGNVAAECYTTAGASREREFRIPARLGLVSRLESVLYVYYSQGRRGYSLNAPTNPAGPSGLSGF